MTRRILRCPKEECGVVLREQGVELFVVVFPTTFDSLRRVLSGSINRAKCPSCGTIVQFDPVVCFIHVSMKKAWLYIPDEIINEYPNLIDECRHKIGSLSNKIGGKWTTEPVESIEVLRTKATEAIRSEFAKIFNQLSFARVEGNESKWLKQNMERLDFAFFSAFQLVLEEALPICLQVAYSRLGKDRHISKEGILQELSDLRIKLVSLRIIHLAEELSNKTDLSMLSEILDRSIPQCVLDEKLINALTNIAESLSKQKNISYLTKYAMEAAVAWAANKASISNPRAQVWAGYVAQLEEMIEASNEEERKLLTPLKMPDEFLRNTLNYRLLWDQIALRLEQMRLEKSWKEAPQRLSPLLSLVTRIGWEDAISEVLSEMFLVEGLDKLSNSDMEMFFNIFIEMLEREGGVDALARGFRVATQAGQFKAAITALPKAIKRLGQEKLDDATYLVSRYAQAFNEAAFYQEADRVIDKWINDLRDSGQWATVKLSRQVDLLNEWGNAKRYQGKLEKAIKLYKDALAICPAASDYQRKILLKNLGIVYRDSGRLLDGIQLIKESLEMMASPAERATTLHSLAICYNLLGDDNTALKYLQQAEKLLASEKPEIFARERSLILLTLLQTLIYLGQKTEALDVLMKLLHLTNEVLKDPVLFAQVASIAVGILSPEKKVQYPEVLELTQRIIEIIERLLKPRIGIRADVRTSLQIWLAQIALSEKDYQRFWNLIAEAEKLPSETLSWDAWRICCLKSQAALEEEDFEKAYGSLQEAWRQLMIQLTRENIGKIPLSFMDDREFLQRQMGSVVWPMVQKRKLSTSYLILTAELQNALLQNIALCSNEDILTRYRNCSLTTDWIMEDIKFLAETFGNKRAVAFLQFLLVDNEYHPLLTLHNDGQIDSFVLGSPLQTQKLNQSCAEFRYAVETYNPKSNRDPIRQLRNWRHFSAIMAHSLRKYIPPGAHICVIPSRELSFLPLHLCSESPEGKPLITDYTFSYVPSIFTAARLRERRLNESRGFGWRPQCFGNFIVWQAGDCPEVSDSFRKHAASLVETIRSKGCNILSSEGHHATQKLLDDFLSKADLLHLCCHGVVSFDTGTHRLLISDGKSLPPSDQRALANPYNDPFFLDWDKIKTDRSPTIVVSCACSSGMISVKMGGERVGFERTLFQRGTSSFIAPLWDVSVFDIHPLVETMLFHYFSSSEQDLSQAVQIAILDAFRMGRARHAVGALALMGDWI